MKNYVKLSLKKSVAKNRCMAIGDGYFSNDVNMIDNIF